MSVIIITKNESAHILDCLESVDFADEIIVMDSGSTDNTVALARAAGAVVHETDWPGFGPQKNRALAKATGDWILSIDADERVTPGLENEILAVMEDKLKDGYEIPRLSSYCGKFIKHSGWSPDYVLRLFRRGAANFSDDIVHERVVMAPGEKGPGRKIAVGKLSNRLLHYSFKDFSQVLEKMDNYSTLSAQQLHAKGRKASIWTALLHGSWAFFRTYVLRRGLLDGGMGLALAISNAEGAYYRYMKLTLLARADTSASKNNR